MLLSKQQRDDLPALRKHLLHTLPNYAVYAHCSTKERTAVITLVRKEVARHTVPLAPQLRPGSPLTGRILALRVSPPNGATFITANVWMPHTGLGDDNIREAFSTLNALIPKWRVIQDSSVLAPLLLCGDFNATWAPEGRPIPSTRHVGDSLLAAMVAAGPQQFTPLLDSLSPTWEQSRRPTNTPSLCKSACIDHMFTQGNLSASKGATLLCETSHQVVSDHRILALTLDTHHGWWNPQ
jgi:endonuclease/exonuclease/phosphatase family metal-dependent hydrolase